MHSVGGGWTSVELKTGINLYNYSGASVLDPYRPDSEAIGPPLESTSAMTPVERDRFLLAESRAAILGRPGVYLHLCLKRALFLLSPVPNFYNVRSIGYWAVGLASLVFVHSLLVALPTQLARRRALPRGSAVLILSLIFWYLSHIAVNAGIRLRSPSDVWLAVLAVSLIPGRRGGTGEDAYSGYHRSSWTRGLASSQGAGRGRPGAPES
jgi:hypothetical protein